MRQDIRAKKTVATCSIPTSAQRNRSKFEGVTEYVETTTCFVGC